jgi:peptidoglycan LD-endopeptidase LytH
MNASLFRCRPRGFIVPALLVLAAGCAPAVRESAPGATMSREQYERELRRTGRAGELLARAWRDAGDAAALTALRVPVPFREGVIFSETVPTALAYRVTLRGGERFEVQADPPTDRRGGVFLELFEIQRDQRLRLVARSAPGQHTIRAQVPRDADYVLLVQPRMDHAGRYRIAIGDVAAPAAPVVATMPAVITTAAAMTFPVQGRTPRNIGSGFGDPRDGGARVHHGVDIFAPRGTPVLAAADGRITNVANTPVGGLVIWQVADGAGHELYYAHLSAQYVRAGQRVRAGDVIGAVGNTGNARTTPPHLHFGVYAAGRLPLDPAPLLADGRIVTERPVVMNVAEVALPPVRVHADTGVLGQLARPSVAMTWVRSYPSEGGAALSALHSGNAVRLLGASPEWFRVVLDDGTSGFVPAGDLAPLNGAFVR